MEDKKPIDTKTLIGYILILGLSLWFFQINSTKEAATSAENSQEVVSTTNTSNGLIVGNTAGNLQSPPKNPFTTIENEVLKITVNAKGGYISALELKQIKDSDGGNVFLIKNAKDTNFNLQLQTIDQKSIATNQLYFTPTVSNSNGNTHLKMQTSIGGNQTITYNYILKPNDYMLDFSIQSQGMAAAGTIDTQKEAVLNWDLSTLRHAQSGSYENRYTDLIFEYESGKDDYVSQRDFAEDDAEEVSYIAYRQHFFSSILLPSNALKNAAFSSKNLFEDEKNDKYLRKFTTKAPLSFRTGELNHDFNWYFGPTDYKTLKSYDRNLDEVVSLGWGIFGWINRFIFIPLFGLLSSVFPYGIAIIVMTVMVRLVLSPVTYKSYLSQAKMRALRSEINVINQKHADNPMKKQKETMELYNKAGVNPASGCIPALMQIPVFYALFSFFPSAYSLRQKSFLWANDLSSYDVVAQLPFNIPFYGDHISLFPILASIAIFFYIKMTSGKAMEMQQQPGMPNMKFLMYLSPVFMLIFFNNYASGLSLYYFVSNLITIGIMFVIKNFIIDENKIQLNIENNKKNPKKPSKFKQRLQAAMEEAERQQKLNNKK